MSCLLCCLQEKDKGTRLAYVAPTIPRRLASTSDIDEKENRWIPGDMWLCANMHWIMWLLLLTAGCPNAVHGVALSSCSFFFFFAFLMCSDRFSNLETHQGHLKKWETYSFSIHVTVETWGTILACGFPGTLLLWYVAAPTPGDAGMTTWRTVKEVPPPSEPPATSAG